jgi:hypothetical protein
VKGGSTKNLSTYSARIGHRRIFAWPRGIEFDSKKLWAPPRTFMGVRPHPDPDEGSY